MPKYEKDKDGKVTLVHQTEHNPDNIQKESFAELLEQSVSTITELLPDFDKGQLQELKTMELEGKNRKGVIDAIEAAEGVNESA